MAEKLEHLFQEFAAAHARGDTPDPRPFLERAGKDAAALRRMLDAYLSAAPGQPPTDETRATVARWLEPGPEPAPRDG